MRLICLGYFREQRPATNNLTLGFGAHKVSPRVPSPLDRHEVRMPVEEIIVHPSFIR